MTKLNIVVPRQLFPSTLRTAVAAGLHAVDGQSSEAGRRSLEKCALELRTVIDCTNLSTASASGLCELLALTEWVRGSATNPADVTVLGGQHFKRFGLDENLCPTQGYERRAPFVL